jgi:xylulokinase
MYLGLDLGTSGLRAVLMTEAGQVMASAQQGYGVSHPQPGWSEQEPQDWITACESCLAQLKTSHGAALSQLRGIGLSGQMHGAVLLDAGGDVLRPAMLWNDTRSHAEASQLDAVSDVRARSGNIVFPGFTAPKLAWLQKHETGIWRRIAKVLLPKDYLRLWLSGDYVSDMSDAAGTSWLDTGARCWSAHLLEASNMRRDQMPDLVEGSQVSGQLRAALAGSWGVAETVIIAGGGGDNAVAACGVGAMHEGQGFVSLGTSGVLLAARDRYTPMLETAVHTFCHAVPDTWYQMGVMLAATDSLNWLARNLGQDAATLAASLGESISAPGHIRFLPYLSGERTPHNDSAVRGAFLNLDIADGPQDLTRAVMEGVCFGLRDSLEALRATGADLQSLLAIGGGTGSRYWLELLATILNLPLDLPVDGDFGAALGAARLAQCAAGSDPEQILIPPETAQTISPRSELSEAYEQAYQSYRATYPMIKALP